LPADEAAAVCGDLQRKATAMCPAFNNQADSAMHINHRVIDTYIIASILKGWRDEKPHKAKPQHPSNTV